MIKKIIILNLKSIEITKFYIQIDIMLSFKIINI